MPRTTQISQTINVTIRSDRDIKESAEKLFSDLGMNLSTAVNVFFRQSLRQGGIPFEINDPFYSPENQAELIRRLDDIEAGQNLVSHKMIEV